MKKLLAILTLAASSQFARAGDNQDLINYLETRRLQDDYYERREIRRQYYQHRRDFQLVAPPPPPDNSLLILQMMFELARERR
jgi:hypothetical protein